MKKTMYEPIPVSSGELPERKRYSTQTVDTFCILNDNHFFGYYNFDKENWYPCKPDAWLKKVEIDIPDEDWISVEDKLPDNENSFSNDLVMFWSKKHGLPMFGCYDYEFNNWSQLPWASCNEFLKFEDVTHWKPAPLNPTTSPNNNIEPNQELKVGDNTRYGIIEEFVEKDGVKMMRSNNPYGTWPIIEVKWEDNQK